MNFLKIPFLLVWRLWFYVLILITILLMSPFLFVLTIKESYYPIFWKLIRGWAHVLVYGMGFRIDKQLDEVLDRDKSYMFCPNHASLMDPFVLIVLSKNPIVFVGKKELVKIPIFGFFYKRAVIMVDRSSPESRKRVFAMAKKRLQGGTSIGIFPEGLVPTEDVILAPFKNGAFSLAIQHQIPIVPQGKTKLIFVLSKNTTRLNPTSWILALRIKKEENKYSPTTFIQLNFRKRLSLYIQ